MPGVGGCHGGAAGVDGDGEGSGWESPGRLDLIGAAARQWAACRSAQASSSARAPTASRRPRRTRGGRLVHDGPQSTSTGRWHSGRVPTSWGRVMPLWWAGPPAPTLRGVWAAWQLDPLLAAVVLAAAMGY